MTNEQLALEKINVHMVDINAVIITDRVDWLQQVSHILDNSNY
jgi:hypothetical protein